MASQSSAAAAIPDDKLEPGGVSVSKRFSVTWKIKQFSEKLTKKNREWVVANNSKKEGVLSPAFDLVFYPSNESPLTVIVEIFDGLRVEIIKLWIVNQHGVKRVAGKLIKKIPIGPKALRYKFEVDQNGCGCKHQSEQCNSVDDLLHNDTLTFLVEMEHLVTMRRPQPSLDPSAGQLGRGLFSMFEDGLLTDFTVICEGNG